MRLRSYLRNKPSAQVLGIGAACFFGAGLLSIVSAGVDLPPLLLGFMAGLAAALAGVSIVINVHSLKRYRAEQNG